MKDIIKKLLRENLDKTITCKKCGWHWKHSEGGSDMYFCHKCGTDNTPDNISEAAKGLGDLPEDTGLFRLNLHDNESDYILYSKSENKIYGVLSIIQINNDVYQVGRVGADRGYGPFMYEMIMSYIAPKYLMPSRNGDVKSRALGVWDKFYQRGDVKKKVLKFDDKLFSFAIITGDENEEYDSIEEKKELFDSLDKEEQRAVIVFNTMYQYSNPVATKLIKKGEELIKSGEVDLKNLNNEASHYFLNLDDY